jgi:peptidoglycan/xylan/chitin deacetylase (PgdA/CDA1 family)
VRATPAAAARAAVRAAGVPVLATAIGLSLTAGRPAAAERPSAPSRTIVVTVDDLPATPAAELAEMRGITRGVLAALRKHRATAVGFVNEDRLLPEAQRSARIALLRQWVDAGHELGNHTYSHADLQTMPLAAFEREVMRGEEETRRLQAERGHGLRFFRHPFTHTGPSPEVKAAFERFLERHGYVVAPFSVEGFDYGFDLLWRRAAEQRDRPALERIRSAYVAHTLAVTEYMEDLARRTFAREIPQILLVHANNLNAAALEGVLGGLVARGYGFVSLEDALRDEAWGTPDRYVGPNGPSWLHRFQLAQGRPLSIAEEPDPPQWVLDAYRAAQAR